MSSKKDMENPKIAETLIDVAESSWYSTLLHHASVYGIAAGYFHSIAFDHQQVGGHEVPLSGHTHCIAILDQCCRSIHLWSIKPLDLLTMWQFLPAAIIFYLSLFSDSKLLIHANVDTFIFFCSAVPMFVAIGETLILHQPWLSLTMICVLYVITHYQFTVMAYSWVVAYLISMSIDFVKIKHVVMTIGLSTWGLVLYNNLEALLLFPLELLIMGELKKIKHEITDKSDWYSFEMILPVGVSCVFGLTISFFGFSCRRAISAAGFTMLGIVNKLLTVVINLVIWDKRSKVLGTIGLLICMLGGVMYNQSMTKPKAAKETQEKQSEEEQRKLLEMQPSTQRIMTMINNEV